jgi:hypothetical protein
VVLNVLFLGFVAFVDLHDFEQVEFEVFDPVDCEADFPEVDDGADGDVFFGEAPQTVFLLEELRGVLASGDFYFLAADVAGLAVVFCHYFYFEGKVESVGVQDVDLTVVGHYHGGVYAFKGDTRLDVLGKGLVVALLVEILLALSLL